MVSISFSVMKDKLLSGEKKHTIRKINNLKRLNQMKRLKKLQIYWKLRTKYTEKLFDATLVAISTFHLDETGYPWAWIADPTYRFARNTTSDVDLLVKFTHDEANKLAIKDGFSSIEDMQAWFVNKYKEKVSGDYAGITFERCEQ
jgi:hypothetical protein